MFGYDKRLSTGAMLVVISVVSQLLSLKLVLGQTPSVPQVVQVRSASELRRAVQSASYIELVQHIDLGVGTVDEDGILNGIHSESIAIWGNCSDPYPEAAAKRAASMRYAVPANSCVVSMAGDTGENFIVRVIDNNDTFVHTAFSNIFFLGPGTTGGNGVVVNKGGLWLRDCVFTNFYKGGFWTKNNQVVVMQRVQFIDNGQSGKGNSGIDVRVYSDEVDFSKSLVVMEDSYFQLDQTVGNAYRCSFGLNMRLTEPTDFLTCTMRNSWLLRSGIDENVDLNLGYVNKTKGLVSTMQVELFRDRVSPSYDFPCWTSDVKPYYPIDWNNASSEVGLADKFLSDFGIQNFTQAILQADATGTRVPAPKGKNEVDLSAGAIAGIVVACCAVLVLCVVAALLFARRRLTRKATPPREADYLPKQTVIDVKSKTGGSSAMPRNVTGGVVATQRTAPSHTAWTMPAPQVPEVERTGAVQSMVLRANTPTLVSTWDSPWEPKELAEQLDAIQAQGHLFASRYALTGVRKVGGQGLVAFANAVQDGQELQVAIKFHFNQQALRNESQLNNISALRGCLPEMIEVDSTESHVAPNGKKMPPFVVLPTGEPLDAFIANECPDSLHCIMILMHLADKLANIHAAGFVHRDVKPANSIWLPSKHEWNVIDFGCAAQANAVCQIMMTPHYAAPEVASAVSNHHRTMVVHPAVDVWALGVVAYELLSGDDTLTRMRQQDLFRALLGADPLPWEDERRFNEKVQIKQEFSRWIRLMLSRDPTMRPTMEEVLEGWRAAVGIGGSSSNASASANHSAGSNTTGSTTIPTTATFCSTMPALESMPADTPATTVTSP